MTPLMFWAVVVIIATLLLLWAVRPVEQSEWREPMEWCNDPECPLCGDVAAEAIR